MEVEIWKDIEEFKDRYQVSNFGRVRSNERFVNAQLFIMTQDIINNCALGTYATVSHECTGVLPSLFY